MVAVLLAKRRLFAALGALMVAAAASGPTPAHGQTVASWISPVSGDWTEPLRWSTNPTYPNNGSPNAGDHYAASINASGATYAVTVSTPITLDSLSITSVDATLRAQTATLTVLGALREDAGQFILDGGAVKSATFNGTSATSYGGTLDQVSIESDLRLTNGTTTFLNGVTLVNGGTLRSSPYVPLQGNLPSMVFSGTQTIGGAGEVIFDENHNNTSVVTTGTLTLGPGVTMRTGAGYGTVSGRFVNQGTISVLSYQGLIEFRGATASQKVTNDGTAIVGNGGSLSFSNGATNLTAGVLTGGTWIARDGSSISIGSAGFANLVNNANIVLSGPGSNVYPMSGIRSNVGTFTIIDGRHFRSSGTLSNSGRFVIGPATVLSIPYQLNNTGVVDLSGGLVVEYEGSSPLHALASQIGTGIISSSPDLSGTHAIGYAERSELGINFFMGVGVGSANAALMRYTFAGDSNLDGKVDVTDLGSLATHWRSSADWVGGDFNYDGFVDVSDLGLLATNWQAGAGGPLGGSLEEALAEVGLPLTSTPEPAGVMTLLGLAGLLIQRRRRH